MDQVAPSGVATLIRISLLGVCSQQRLPCHTARTSPSRCVRERATFPLRKNQSILTSNIFSRHFCSRFSPVGFNSVHPWELCILLSNKENLHHVKSLTPSAALPSRQPPGYQTANCGRDAQLNGTIPKEAADFGVTLQTFPAPLQIPSGTACLIMLIPVL